MTPKDPPPPNESQPPAEQSDGPVEETVTARQVSASYSGPIPPASQLEAYNRIDPTFADRIISMAEGYAAHTQDIEKVLLRQERSDQKSARHVAAGVVIAVLVTCIWALYLDKEEFATTLGSWTIVALAGVFVAGKIPDWLRKKDESSPSPKPEE